MVHLLFVCIVLLALILILYISVVLGRMFGQRQLHLHPRQKLEVIQAAEASVFALLGLLIAFTFSGAYDRYEARKLHILEEANAFEEVYNYLEYLPSMERKLLHNSVSQYLNMHLDAYHHQPYTALVDQALDRALQIEGQIWKHAMMSAQNIKNDSISANFINAVNVMFSTAHTGMNLSRVHPPLIIFGLMIGLAALGGFLVGYDAAESKQARHIHTVSYILLTAFTIYIVINLEYPRTGFIRLNNFDRVLTDVRDNDNLSYHDNFMLS